ncbi:hypothetical protein [Mocis latipes granulovirus]|uniref:Uncharacterized protein n=1 Tax=Mocis latipes granulovirus TaxID=2072024 RepID=A0A162GVA2_9BBAC|nr:hypothetical protein [Mocis latipes granulovirus]AKR17406.1 hypothetical protein [Mocis latipes granulovirus]
MDTPAKFETRKFFAHCFTYLNTLPTLEKPNSKTHPREYFLYQLLQCYISHEEGAYRSTREILNYLIGLLGCKTLIDVPRFSNDIKSSYEESESVVMNDEERQNLNNLYIERTLKRKLAYEQRSTDPKAYNEFNNKRVKKIEQRRQTEPATGSLFSPLTQNKSPGFVVSSQEPQQQEENKEKITMSPYNPHVISYEPSVDDLYQDGYIPKEISTPAHMPPALNGDAFDYTEFTPRRSTEDLEENLADIAANLDDGGRISRQTNRDTPCRSRSSSVSSFSSNRSSRRSSSSSSSCRSRSPSPLKAPTPPPRKAPPKNRSKGVAFMIKDKGVYSCMSGYSSYLKSKIKRAEGVILVEPMYIVDDNLDLATVWTKLSNKILNKFPFLSKVNKTLKSKSISAQREQEIQSYIVKQLKKMNFK